jgi:hypothetical protein
MPCSGFREITADILSDPMSCGLLSYSRYSVSLATSLPGSIPVD